MHPFAKGLIVIRSIKISLIPMQSSPIADTFSPVFTNSLYFINFERLLFQFVVCRIFCWFKPFYWSLFRVHLNRKMHKPTIRGRSMPMLRTWRNLNYITRMDMPLARGGLFYARIVGMNYLLGITLVQDRFSARVEERLSEVVW